jgi:hypothetical protein
MVTVSLGRSVELRLDDIGILSVTHTDKGITTSILPIGEATKARLLEIQILLERLKAFATDSKITAK